MKGALGDYCKLSRNEPNNGLEGDSVHLCLIYPASSRSSSSSSSSSSSGRRRGRRGRGRGRGRRGRGRRRCRRRRCSSGSSGSGLYVSGYLVFEKLIGDTNKASTKRIKKEEKK